MDDSMCPLSIEFYHIAQALLSKSDFFELSLEISQVIERVELMFLVTDHHLVFLWLILITKLLRLQIDDLFMMSFEHFKEIFVVVIVIDGNFFPIFILIFQLLCCIHVEKLRKGKFLYLFLRYAGLFKRLGRQQHWHFYFQLLDQSLECLSHEQEILITMMLVVPIQLHYIIHAFLCWLIVHRTHIAIEPTSVLLSDFLGGFEHVDKKRVVDLVHFHTWLGDSCQQITIVH